MMLDLNVFSDYNCKKAILKFDGNLARATSWLLSCMDEECWRPPDSDDDALDIADSKGLNQMYKCGKPGIYELQSFITHIGRSLEDGHYVCHIKKSIAGHPTKQWVQYDDEKVSIVDQPHVPNGYMYWFTKLEELPEGINKKKWVSNKKLKM